MSRLFRAVLPPLTCRGGDAAMLAFIGDRPVAQPNLFFASIQYVVGNRVVPQDRCELAADLLIDEADRKRVTAHGPTPTPHHPPG